MTEVGVIMYNLIKTGLNEFDIKIDNFVIGSCFLSDDETWHSVVKDERGYVGLRYCNEKRKKSIEGLIKQIIYSGYNGIID